LPPVLVPVASALFFPPTTSFYTRHSAARWSRRHWVIRPSIYLMPCVCRNSANSLFVLFLC